MLIITTQHRSVRIIIAWGFAAGAGVYEVERAQQRALIKRPFRAE